MRCLSRNLITRRDKNPAHPNGVEPDMDRLLPAPAAVVIGAFVVACTSLATSERAVHWELRTQPGPGATTVDIDAIGGGCAADEEVLGRVSVEETTETVTITTTIRKPAVSDAGVCPDIARVHPATVELDAPIGDRRLLDGSTGAQP